MKICLFVYSTITKYLIHSDAYYRTYLPDGIQDTTYDDSDWEDEREYLDHRDPEYIALEDHPDDPPPPERPNKFKNITDAIVDALDDFDEVIPKLNWSSPNDALWSHPQQHIQCSCVAHILLMLKCSYTPDCDLHHMFDSCVPQTQRKEPPQPTLSLIKNEDVDSGREFRCFVINRTFCAISQRNCWNYYDGITDPDIEVRVKETLTNFIDNVILPKFTLNNFTVDVHLDRNLKKVLLIDLGVLTEEHTDALLYDWEELDTLYDRTIKERETTESNISSSSTQSHNPSQQPSANSSDPSSLSSSPSSTSSDDTDSSLLTSPLPLFRVVRDANHNLNPAFCNPGLVRAPDDAPEALTAAGKWTTLERIRKANKEREERLAKEAAEKTAEDEKKE